MKSITKRFASKLCMAAAVCMALIGAGCIEEEPSTEPSAELRAELRTEPSTGQYEELSPELQVELLAQLSPELRAENGKFVKMKSQAKQSRDIGIAGVILSFEDTCDGEWSYVVDGIARQASASRCKKMGSGYRYDRKWGPARCWDNLSNCDGNIVCQVGCPL